MFQFLLVLSGINQVLKFLYGQIGSLLLLGLPILWSLGQRKRLKAFATTRGWLYKPTDRLREFGHLHKDVEGIRMEIWAGSAFGAKIFGYFSTRKHVDMEKSRPTRRSRKKLRDFKTGNARFDCMFGTMRGRDKEIQGLAEHPEVLDAVVELRRRWVFHVSDLHIGNGYMLLYMTYGTPFAYHLPPRVLDKLSADVARVTKLLDKALGTQGEKNDP